MNGLQEATRVRGIRNEGVMNKYNSKEVECYVLLETNVSKHFAAGASYGLSIFSTSGKSVSVVRRFHQQTIPFPFLHPV